MPSTSILSTQVYWVPGEVIKTFKWYHDYLSELLFWSNAHCLFFSDTLKTTFTLTTYIFGHNQRGGLEISSHLLSMIDLGLSIYSPSICCRYIHFMFGIHALVSSSICLFSWSRIDYGITSHWLRWILRSVSGVAIIWFAGSNDITIFGSSSADGSIPGIIHSLTTTWAAMRNPINIWNGRKRSMLRWLVNCRFSLLRSWNPKYKEWRLRLWKKGSARVLIKE